MMWRVLAALDFITVQEVHFGVLPPVPAVGVSTGIHSALGFWAFKYDQQCFLGPIPINMPPCLGHDASIGRPHILIDPSPVPPPPAPPATPLNSIASSASATMCSAMKPTFSASKDLRNGGGQGPLPVSTEALPFGAGIVFSGNVVCGLGPPHMGIPMIPTQFMDWSGLTLGDIIGGFVNMRVEMFWQGVLECFAIVPGLKWGAKGTAKVAKVAVDAVAKNLSKIVAWGPAIGINFWPSGENTGRAVRNLIDGCNTEQMAKDAAAQSSSPGSPAPSSGGSAGAPGGGSVAAGGDGGSSSAASGGGQSGSDSGGSLAPTFSPFGM